jgi:hypothetical protein
MVKLCDDFLTGTERTIDVVLIPILMKGLERLTQHDLPETQHCPATSFNGRQT